MNRRRWIFLIAVMVLLALPIRAEAGIKVAVVPSILNMFIQYGVVNGMFKEDPEFFEKTYQDVTAAVAADPAFQLSGHAFGTDSDAVNKFMMSQPYPSSTERYDADILVMVGNSDDGKSMEIFMVAVESGRAVSYFVDRSVINNENLSAVIVEKMKQGLTLAEELIKVSSDEIYDAEESVAEYVLPGVVGKDLIIRFDYDAAHTALEAVLVQPAEAVLDGWHDYSLVSEEGSAIKLSLASKGGDVNDMRVEIDYEPEADTADGWKAFHVKSKAGFQVAFTFYWSGGEREKVVIEPEENPFLPHTLPGG